MLEIGCGWGGLAEALVQRAGAHVTGVTLSPAQMQLRPVTSRRARRQISGCRITAIWMAVSTAVVSIEMLEAVGAAYWPDFFARLNASLKPGARAVLQVISIAEDRFDTYLRRPDFIQRHIFPGGMLPTVEIMRREIGQAGPATWCRWKASAKATPRPWRNGTAGSKCRVAATLRGQGFDERFRRKWRYYLQYCEGGFRAGAIDVGLYTVVKGA